MRRLIIYNIQTEGRRPLGAVLHSSNEPGELSQWLCHDDSTINIGICIISILPRRLTSTKSDPWFESGFRSGSLSCRFSNVVDTLSVISLSIGEIGRRLYYTGIVINLQKSPMLQWWRQTKSYPESVSANPRVCKRELYLVKHNTSASTTDHSTGMACRPVISTAHVGWQAPSY